MIKNNEILDKNIADMTEEGKHKQLKTQLNLLKIYLKKLLKGGGGGVTTPNYLKKLWQK